MQTQKRVTMSFNFKNEQIADAKATNIYKIHEIVCVICH